MATRVVPKSGGDLRDEVAVMNKVARRIIATQNRTAVTTTNLSHTNESCACSFQAANSRIGWIGRRSVLARNHASTMRSSVVYTQDVSQMQTHGNK